MSVLRRSEWYSMMGHESVRLMCTVLLIFQRVLLLAFPTSGILNFTGGVTEIMLGMVTAHLYVMMKRAMLIGLT